MPPDMYRLVVFFEPRPPMYDLQTRAVCARFLPVDGDDLVRVLQNPHAIKSNAVGVPEELLEEPARVLLAGHELSGFNDVARVLGSPLVDAAVRGNPLGDLWCQSLVMASTRT